MTRRSRPLHLKLVINNSPGPQQVARRHRKPEQLAFPYPEPTSVLLADIGGIDRAAFMALLRDMMPRWVIDIRTVPTFEAIAGSRSYAFRLFDSVKADYVDFLGRLQSGGGPATSAPEDWSASLVMLLRTAPHVGPYLFLFDDLNILHAAETLIPGAMETLIGRRPSVSVFVRSLAEA